jgi:hypothetical protein
MRNHKQKGGERKMTLGWKLTVVVIGVCASVAYGVAILDHYKSGKIPWNGSEQGNCNPGGRTMQIDDPYREGAYKIVAVQFANATPLVTTSSYTLTPQQVSEAIANSAKW